MEYKIFGCKVNKYYTDKWLNSEYLKDKNWIFVASCVVTDQAKRKWIKFIKEIFKDKKDLNIWFDEWKLPESQSLIGWVFEWIKSNSKSYNNFKVYISWCWAFKDWKAQDNFFELYPELEQFKDKIEILWEDPDNEKISQNILKQAKWFRKIENNKNLEKLKNKLKNQIYTKKFVLIQWGCDSFCSFCLTVKKRWKHYYRAKEDIVKEILDFEKSWWKEVVLTGINLSAWGQKSTNDFENPRFKELIKYILENTKIPRIRISSLWPEFIDDETIKLFENTRIYPHFHISVQSGSTNVLKNMKRHYSWEYIKNLLLKLRNLKREDEVIVSIWADIIVGFPWETENDFKKTLELIKDCEITKVHAFPFSAHKLWENVPAWFFKNQIDDKTKKERMNKILDLSEKIRQNFINKNIWKTFKILIEQTKEDWSFKGWTENYIESSKENIEIISWEVKRNEIIIWKLKKNL